MHYVVTWCLGIKGKKTPGTCNVKQIAPDWYGMQNASHVKCEVFKKRALRK